MSNISEQNWIESLLKPFNLSEYIPKFKELGYDSYEKSDLLDLTENDINEWINDLNITNNDDIKQLKLAINNFKNSYKSSDKHKRKQAHRHKKSNVTCKVYTRGNILPNISNHVFISKQATQYLADYIVKENWGKDNILLYKYLDYIWRLQLIDEMVKKFYFRNERRLIFHTGLYTRDTNEDVYICLVPNNINPNKTKYTQQWRVTLGNYGQRYCSFMTKKKLIVIHNLNEKDVPIKTTFNENKVTFNPNYRVTMKLYDRVRTAKDRILQTLKNDIGYNGEIEQSQLELLVDQGLTKAINDAKINPNICGKQIFMERDLINDKKLTKGYHLELLLPLTLTINGLNAYFAIALRINNILKEYEVMSIITREMAYSNARLIGYVNINWLNPFVDTNKLIQLPLLTLPTINNIPNLTTITNNININNINNNTDLSLQQQLYNTNIINIMSMLHVTLPRLH